MSGLKIILAGLFFTFVSLAYSQEPLNYSTVDKKSYQYYLDGRLDSLRIIAHEAFAEGIDYYYLRMRMGVLYYNHKNYMAAIPHFRKALGFNNGDPVAEEYLYFALILSGRKKEAEKLAATFSDSLKSKLNIEKTPVITGVSATISHSNLINNDVLDNYNFDASSVENGSQLITRKFNYQGLHLQHQISPTISLFHGYGHLKKTSFGYYYTDGIKNILTEQELTQHQYYISGTLTFRKGFSISPAFHFLNVRIPVYQQNSGGMWQRTSVQAYSQNDYIYGLSLNQYFPYINLQAGAIWSQLNGRNQLQESAGLTLYPLGNLNFYLFADVIFHHNVQNQLVYVPEKIYRLKAGAGFFDTFWLEAGIIKGNLENTSMDNGYIIYNNTDYPTGIYEISLIVPVNKFSFYVSYSLSEQQSVYRTTGTAVYNKLTYNSQTITGGISWKF